MQQISQLLALAATLSTASAGAIQGFNYGSTGQDGSAMMQADFETSFKTAANLVGTDGAFTSARLYTMIQGLTTSDVIQAIPAAIATNTTLLLGLWCSGDGFENEITALKAAIATYGSQGLGDLVTGISVGSEDLYRNSATSIANGGGIGQAPATLVDYITQVKNTIAGTALSGASIGHVDTWDAWTNGTNAAVIEAIDWLGVDEYPYWQKTDSNAVENGASLFQKAFDVTKAAAGSKPVWVTETGWAVNGPTEGDAVAGTSQSKSFWDAVGCGMLFGEVNTYWYTLSETGASPDFSISQTTSDTTPLYDLKCPAKDISTSTSTSSSSSSSGTSGSGSGSSGSGTVSSGFSIATSSSGSNSSVLGTNATATASKSGASSTSGSGSGSSSSPSASTSAVAGSSGTVANTASIGGFLVAAALAIFAL